MRRKRSAKRRPVIDKSCLAISTERKEYDEKYRRWIASLNCVVTGMATGNQCIHIRHEGGAGMGQKPSDYGHCLPLYHLEHAKQHAGSEVEYWNERGGIDRAKSLAKDLHNIWVNGADRAEAVFRIMKFQRGE